MDSEDKPGPLAAPQKIQRFPENKISKIENQQDKFKEITKVEPQLIERWRV